MALQSLLHFTIGREQIAQVETVAQWRHHSRQDRRDYAAPFGLRVQLRGSLPKRCRQPDGGRRRVDREARHVLGL